MSSLLPSNATQFERDIEELLQLVVGTSVDINKIMSAQDCPVELLPWFAWHLSVDTWSDDWNEEQKRQMVKRSVSVHRMKGTRRALELALGALYVDVEVIEWFETEPKERPATFDLRVHLPADYQMNIGTYDEIRTVTSNAKNLRSHLNNIELTPAEIDQSAIVSAAAVAGHKFVIYELGRQDPELLEY